MSAPLLESRVPRFTRFLPRTYRTGAWHRGMLPFWQQPDSGRDDLVGCDKHPWQWKAQAGSRQGHVKAFLQAWESSPDWDRAGTTSVPQWACMITSPSPAVPKRAHMSSPRLCDSHPVVLARRKALAVSLCLDCCPAIPPSCTLVPVDHGVTTLFPT